MGREGPCCHCGIDHTPLWRTGPAEKPVLCNACGSRWRIRGTLAAYTPKHGFLQSRKPKDLPLNEKPAIPGKDPDHIKSNPRRDMAKFQHSSSREDHLNNKTRSGSSSNCSQMGITGGSIERKEDCQGEKMEINLCGTGSQANEEAESSNSKNEEIPKMNFNAGSGSTKKTKKIIRKKRSDVPRYAMSPTERLHKQLLQVKIEQDLSSNFVKTEEECPLIFERTWMNDGDETLLGARLLTEKDNF